MRARLYAFWCFWSVCTLVAVALTANYVVMAVSGEWGNDDPVILLIALVIDWIALISCCLFTWHRVAIGWAYVLAREEFYEQMGRIFLWGYPLSEIIQQELPQRLGNYYGSGFCHEFSAAIMYGLEGTKTARLCHGIDPEHGHHSWVEYRKYGVWWVADSAWVHQEYVPWPRLAYKKAAILELESICKYREFWQGPFAKAIKVLTNPEHELQDSLLIDFFPVFWPVYGYGMKEPDKNGYSHPIVGYKAIKPTQPASEEVKANLKDRSFIARIMNDPSFCALEDVGDAT